MHRTSIDYPFGVEADEQRYFKFLEDDPVFQRDRFARLTAEPMLSRIRPRIEQLVEDRVELELVRALPLLAERLFDDIWKEKLNDDVQSFVCRTLGQYLEIFQRLERIIAFFEIPEMEFEDDKIGRWDDNWWRGDAGESDDGWWREGQEEGPSGAGPTDFDTPA